MKVINLHEFEDAAKKALSVAAYDYVAAGAGDELTLRANREAFSHYWIRRKVMVDVTKVDTSFELFGKTGVLKVEGLGGSYGPERLTLARMTPEMGRPGVESWAFPGEDTSWGDEYRALLDAIDGRPSAIARLDDALAVLEVVDAAYAACGRAPVAARP